MVNSHSGIKLIGRTRDDACGEFFDKVSNHLGFGYPGGRIIDEMAEKGDGTAFKFPLPMAHSRNLDMSFSGLKTAVISKIESLGGAGALKESVLYDIAASAREAAASVLWKKTFKACESLRVKTVVVSGGVAANSRIRKLFKENGDKNGMEVIFPPAALSTDNAAMIGYAGYFKPSIDPVKDRERFIAINADSSWEL